jgi:hypothetical protein
MPLLTSTTSPGVEIQILQFLLQFGVTGLFLQLATQSLNRAPYLSRFSDRLWFQVGQYLLVLSVTVVLTFWFPSLRALAALQVAPDPGKLVWADICISALALAQLSRVWTYLLRWLERKSAG